MGKFKKALTVLATSGVMVSGVLVSASPASAANIPSDCTITAKSTSTTTVCTQRAHRAAVKCTGGQWYFGPWVNKGQRSVAYCASGQIALDHSIDLPE